MNETPQQDRVNTEHLRNYEKLRRSTVDRKVAGVAGGLGRHLNIDPTIFRVLFVVLCFFGGAGFVLYGAAWLLVPEDGTDRAAVSTHPNTRYALLIGATAIAALLLVGDSWGGFGFPWPLAIIALIVFVILMNRDKPVAMPTSGPETRVDDDTASYEAAPQGPVHYGPTRYVAPPPPRADRGPLLFGFTLALIAVALGTLGLFDVAGVSVSDAAYPALALTVVGAMLVVGAWFGRAGGLILLGIVAALALAATALANPRFDGDRRIDVSPDTAALVQDRYFVPAGSVYVDLRDVSDVQNLDGRTIDVEANAGGLVVVLPDNVSADVDANVQLGGDASVPGHDVDGLDVHLRERVDALDTEAAHINLNLDLVVGDIEVRQS
jgi:phage shock protein PspC (stress-responsive transcriptional regulator)